MFHLIYGILMKLGFVINSKNTNMIGDVDVPLYNVTAAEKGETSTIVAMPNAVGQLTAPIIIRERKWAKCGAIGEQRIHESVQQSLDSVYDGRERPRRIPSIR